MTPDQLNKWFAKVELRTDLDPDETRAVFALFDQPGFALLWGLMLGNRQTHYATLAQLPNYEPAQAYRTAVIQGHIKGIESLHQTLLELTQPANADAAEGAKS